MAKKRLLKWRVEVPSIFVLDSVSLALLERISYNIQQTSCIIDRKKLPCPF